MHNKGLGLGTPGGQAPRTTVTVPAGNGETPKKVGTRVEFRESIFGPKMAGTDFLAMYNQ